MKWLFGNLHILIFFCLIAIVIVIVIMIFVLGQRTPPSAPSFFETLSTPSSSSEFTQRTPPLAESFTRTDTPLRGFTVLPQTPHRGFTFLQYLYYQISMEPFIDTYDASLNIMSRYNPDNFNLTYHETIPYGDIYDTKMKEITVLNEKGQLTVLPYAPSQNLPIYYDPTQKKDVKPFIPSYTESVLLSNASTPTTSTALNQPKMTTVTTHPYAISISLQRK